jgi:predicted nucleic acid-binding protein
MSGAELKYLLDTNYILGLLKSDPAVLADISERKISVVQCAYSPITRMELLGFSGITETEDWLIRKRLQALSAISWSLAIEERTIVLRQSRKIKLPDAIIAATALCENIELLTLDQHLKAVFEQHKQK